ncbi:thioester-containing protein 1 allele S3-like [Sabethes cyaneus]|uniref:thioester-containing protein 1 allele S3-like n=1 Tax=Sabethes cyaneus TaxID=53552 RepID=UPI00237EBED5|nr:thioester-containing protein 1 allele S3-like [Sabethes cyaneus]
MQWLLWKIILLFIVDHCQGSFLAIVPNVIREHSTSSLALTNINSGNNLQFELILKQGTVPNWKSQVSVQENETVLVFFKTKNLGNDQYMFAIRELGDPDATYDVQLEVIQKSALILIQTDKPIYKPGETVKFRVLVLDHETKPLKKVKSINIKIKDSKRNLIYEWHYAKMQNGIFQSQLELAHFVALGHWTITVVAGIDENQQTFRIAEYVLPKHEIRIWCTKVTTVKDKVLPLIIDAAYTFGKPIKGSLSLSIEDTEKIVSTEINGRTFVSIDLPVIDDQSELDEINILASVVDSESKHIFKSSKTIEIYPASHKITLRKSSENITPDVPFKCWLTLLDPLGNPIEYPDVIKVKVTHEIPFWIDRSYTIERTPNEKGVLPLQIESVKNTEKLKLKVTYAGETTYFTVHEEKDSDKSNPFLVVSVLTETPKIGQPLQILVTSSFKIQLLTYFVLSQGEIIVSKTLNVNKRWVILEETVNFRMVPQASLVAFTVFNNRIIKATEQLMIEDLNNFVNLTLSSHETEPSEQLKVLVKSHPGSMIGLQAIDKSILTLANGNDLTKKTVFDNLKANLHSFNQDPLEQSGFVMLTDLSDNSNSIEMTLFALSTRFSSADPTEGASHIRKNFPETWLWSDLVPIDSSGEITISGMVPDTITNWQISALSINSERGLGIIDKPVSLNVLKRFFIVLNLAYSILKTEVAVVEVFVFNYLETQQESTVTFLNQQKDFYFVDHQNQSFDKPEETLSVTIPANSVRTVTFLLKPRSSGEFQILVKAAIPTATDTVQRSLRVTPGGLQYYRNIPRFIEVEDSSQHFRQLKLVIPPVATPGSENITFSVEGILLGAALTNLGGLIRLPSGCGEQNMLNLVPSVLVLEYLSSTDTLDKTTKQKAIDYLTKGYQNQLNYKLRDGSFSVFGQRDVRGSVFLTAFVAKTFQIAGKHITVDSGVTDAAFKWLQAKQDADGKYAELGKIYHQKIQGGLSGGVTLTAYTISAFLEHKNTAHHYRAVVDKGANFIAERLNHLTRPYDLALAAYALQLAGHPRKQLPLDKLLEQSITDANRTMRWWNDGSTNIETAAYVLLTMMSAGLYVDATPIMRWLVSQRYDKGGYDNTQNTFVGLKALAEYSHKLSTSRNNYEVTLSYGADETQVVHVDAQSSLKSQSLALPTNVRSVDVSITGTGTGVFQIAYQYNTIAADDKPRFEIIRTVLSEGTTSDLKLAICARYKPLHRDEIMTNMVLMEILFPSGYVIADETKESLDSVKVVRKMEAKRDDTLLVLYFDSLSTEESTCINVTGLRKAVVLGQIAGWIKVYDYYDPTREAIEYFNPTIMDQENEL